MVVFSWQEALHLVVRDLWRSMIGERPPGCWHAVPQGLCENSINAIKLLANQQKDGDSSVQSIVTGLCERSTKGIMEGLRNFIEVDNHSALDVGYLKEGTRSFEVQRPKCEEGSHEVSTMEGSEELTLRTEEVGAIKTCINDDHIAKERWGPPLVDAHWHAFCQAIYEVLKEKIGKNCRIPTK